MEFIKEKLPTVIGTIVFLALWLWSILLLGLSIFCILYTN